MSTLTFTTQPHVFNKSLTLNQNFSNFIESISQDLSTFKLLPYSDHHVIDTILFSFSYDNEKKHVEFTLPDEIYNSKAFFVCELAKLDFFAFTDYIKEELYSYNNFYTIFDNDFTEEGHFLFNWTISSLKFSYDTRNCFCDTNDSYYCGGRLLISVTIGN